MGFPVGSREYLVCDVSIVRTCFVGGGIWCGEEEECEFEGAGFVDPEGVVSAPLRVPWFFGVDRL